MTTLAALKCHVRNPTTSVRRIGCKFYELFHPEEPWMAQETPRISDKHRARAKLVQDCPGQVASISPPRGLSFM
jgi:hypothetical protein